MGAGQSTDSRANHQAQDAAALKTSYYELLAVDRHATDDE